MPDELSKWNAPALRILQTIFSAAAPFDVELQGSLITVSIQSRDAQSWPEPPPLGLSAREHGAWPNALAIHAEWAGGSTYLRVNVVRTGSQTGSAVRYQGHVALEVETRSGSRLVWLNIPAAIAKEDGAEVELCLLTAIVKRQDNSEQSEALAQLVRNAGFAFGTRKKVSLGRVRGSSGELLSPRAAYFQNLIKFSLLKLPFFSADARDFEGVYFVGPTSDGDHESTSALDTVTATTHQGLMLPALAALMDGPRSSVAVESHIQERWGGLLTEGDSRRSAAGRVLWRYNTRWALSHCKQRGEADNPTRGQWVITPAGRKRVEHELPAFDIKTYQTLQAKVLPLDASGGKEEEQAEHAPTLRPPDHNSRWHQRLAPILDTTTLQRLTGRVRPDLGCSPREPIARNVVLVGPPGTGKTWLAEKLAHALTGEHPSREGLVRVVQFHPSYGYEDFIWSIRPVLSGENAGFGESPGPLMTICRHAAEDPDRFYVLIIDEINRGDPARIFGELLYAMEYRGREVVLASGLSLSVPTNLVVIGTMNSVDRSVGMLDYALRRRFAFVRVEPMPSAISKAHGTKASVVAAAALERLNTAIRDLGDPELQLGHSYFLAPGCTLASEEDLANIWALDLQPQLAELFHGRAAGLEHLTQVWNDAVRAGVAPIEVADEEEDEDEDPAGAANGRATP